MIQANELRLNNWVYSQEIGENVQISAISEDGFSFKDCVTWDYQNIEEIHPIPLTEETLLKCGFENNKYGGLFIYTPQSSMICIYTDGSVKCNGRYIDVKINYLHQLQNLYFALTGEELEINL